MNRRLIITIDGLNARFLGPYGNSWISTPFFDRMASRGLVFDQFYAESNDCNQVLPALFSGQHPLLENKLAAKPSHRSILVTDDDRLTDDVKNLFDVVELVLLPNTDSTSSRYDSLFGAAIETLAELDAAQDFTTQVWIHSKGMYGSWDAPIEFQDRFKDESDPEAIECNVFPSLTLESDFDPDERVAYLHAYAAEVLLLDFCLNDLFEALSEQDQNLTLILAGVQGFALGEHLEIGPEPATLFSEKVHVPLITVDCETNPGRVSSLTGSKEFAELIALGSDHRLPQGDDKKVMISASKSIARIQTCAWSYIHTTNSDGLDSECNGKLFVKPDDFMEINEVSNVCPAVASAMRQELARYLAAFQQGSTPDPTLSSTELFENVS